MRVEVRLAAVLIALLIPAAILGSWRFGAASSPSAAQRSIAIPDRVGSWAATDEAELDPESLALIAPDTYAFRLYEAPGRPPIWLYVGLYLGRAGHGKGAHDPEICYPAQGWEIIRTERRRLDLGNADALSASALTVELQGVRTAVLHWFQPAGRWPRGNTSEQILRLWDAVTNRPQYAFVRLSAVHAQGRSGEEEREALREFGARIAPAIRAEVERY